MTFGEYVRVHKQQKLEGNLSKILNKIETSILKMGEIFIEREGYTTGGNSFCYLNITKVNNEYLAGVIHVGKYPLYDINIKLRNLNKEYSSAQEPMTYIKIGDLSANIVKKLNNLS